MVDNDMEFSRIVRNLIKNNMRDHIMFSVVEPISDHAQMTKNIILEKFPSQQQFSLMIEDMAKELNQTYVDTIVYYCEKNEIDIESVSKLINPTLKDKIQIEYENLNMLPKKPKLKKH